MYSKRKYIINFAIIILSIINLIMLNVINVKMCKTFSWIRIFTINSTVCKNITIGENMLEKVFTTMVLSFGLNLTQDIMYIYNKNNYIKDSVDYKETN